MEYGELIKGAFAIARRNPRLWPFGVLAGASGGNFGFSYDSGGSFHPDAALIVLVAVAAAVLVVLAGVFSVISQGALAEGVAAIQRGEQRGFRHGLRSGRNCFWRLVGLFLLVAAIGLAVALAVVLVAGGAVLAAFVATHAIALRVLAVVFAVVAALGAIFVVVFPLVLVSQHASRCAVLRADRPVAALRGGWRTLRTNLAPSVLVFLIQQGLMFAAYTAMALASLLFCLPAIVTLLATGGGAAGIAVAVVTGVVLLPALLVAAGAVGTFGHGLWTLSWVAMQRTPR